MMSLYLYIYKMMSCLSNSNVIFLKQTSDVQLKNVIYIYIYIYTMYMCVCERENMLINFNLNLLNLTSTKQRHSHPVTNFF